MEIPHLAACPRPPQGDDGKWNKFGGRLAWDKSAICSNNPAFGGSGGMKSAEDYPAAPNIDHSQARRMHRVPAGRPPALPGRLLPHTSVRLRHLPRHLRGWARLRRCGAPCPVLFRVPGSPVSSHHHHHAHEHLSVQERIRKDIAEWMRWLRNSIGFDGWRFDYVKVGGPCQQGKPCRACIRGSTRAQWAGSWPLACRVTTGAGCASTWIPRCLRWPLASIGTPAHTLVRCPPGSWAAAAV